MIWCQGGARARDLFPASKEPKLLARHAFIRPMRAMRERQKCSSRTTDIRNLHAQRRRQVNLVILLIYENLPNQFRHCKFAELFALPNPDSIIPDRLVFVLQVKSKHFLCIF